MKGDEEYAAIRWTDLPSLHLQDSLHPLSLTDTAVHLWLIQLDVPQQALQVCRQLLSPDEHERAERFRFQHLRDRYTISRGAARHILGLYLNIPAAALRFDYGPQGKPSLTNEAHLAFNLSHSCNLALLAIARNRRIGIDIEHCKEKRDLEQIAARMFTHSEAATIASLQVNQRTQAFYACWTLKEAYLKALGEGLSTPLDGYEVLFPPAAPATLASIASSPTGHLQWQASSFTLDDYAAALIFEGPHHTIHRAVWPPDSHSGDQP